jgi:hypothetical protein
MTSTVVPVDTPQGPGRLFVDLADQPSAILVLGHGAGGGVGSADLELLARDLPGRGTSVVRFEQPWRTAGRKASAPPPRLDEAWFAALEWLTGQDWAQQSSVWRSHCTCPAGPRSHGSRNCWHPMCQGWCCKAAKTALVRRMKSALLSAMDPASPLSSCRELITAFALRNLHPSPRRIYV